MAQEHIDGGELVAGAQSIGGLGTRLAELINESNSLEPHAGDWRGPVATALADALLNSEQAELQLDDPSSKQVLNLALYQMSYQAALACEHARHTLANGRGSFTRSDGTSNVASGEQAAETTGKQRLQSDSLAHEDQRRTETVETLVQLARLLCVGLIDAYQALDRYDFTAMDAALEDCESSLPPGFTLKAFRALQCLRAIAQAGLSRDNGSAAPSLRSLDDLALLISKDRNDGGVPHADHALLLMVTSIGHMKRGDLVDDAAQCETLKKEGFASWSLGVLHDLETRGVAEPEGWPSTNEHNPIAHHVHYYRYFAHHVRAMALANCLKEVDATEPEETSDNGIATVREEYRMASTSLERALQLVPASNEARWRYYDLNAENLEHEESLRLELLEQRVTTRRTVRKLAEDNVRQFSETAKEELRSQMAQVSMRIVEIIGLFLAVVAILGSTVASATVDDLSAGTRMLILAIGGIMPVIYFVLLRWIVSGQLSRRWESKRGANQ